MANDRRVGNLLVQMRAEIGGLKTDIKELEKSFNTGFTGIQNSAATAFKNVGASIAAAFSVTAIIGFGKSIVELGGRLKDLEEQTGISGQLLSGMKSTIEESGSSLDAFAKGIFTAQTNLGQIDKDTDQAAVAIKQLGLNLNELRNATPEKFLELIAEALAKIENPVQRAAAGAAILGRTYQELGPVITQLAGHFEELRAKGLTQEDIKLLDEAGDAWTRLTNRVMLASATLFTDAIRTIDTIKRLMSISGFLKSSAGAGAAIGAVGGGVGSADLEEALAGSLKAEQKAVAPFVGTAGKPATIKAAKEAKIELDHLRDGFSELEESAFRASQAMIPVFDELRKLNMTPLERQLAEINTRFDEMAVKIKVFGEATRQDIQPFLEDLEFSRSQELLKLQPDEDLWDLPDTMTAKVKESKGAWDDLFVSVGSGLQSTLDGIIRGTQTWGELWRNLLANIAANAANALSGNLIQGLLGSTVSSGGGFLSTLFGSLGSVPLATASGGIFRSPTLRLIGEAGPEAVVPLPRMNEMGGKPTVTINGSIIPNPGITRDQVIQIGVEQFRTRSAWTQMYESRRSKG